MAELILLFVVISVSVLISYLVFAESKPDSPAHESNKDFLLAEANKAIGELQTNLERANFELGVTLSSHKDLEQRFQKLQHQKVSADVKLGQRAEHLLPFLESFPYREDEIKGLFQPIDLIVFRPDEVVFVEIKTGAAQLSEKERRIRDNIKAGRVRFEVHRMNEKGVTVK